MFWAGPLEFRENRGVRRSEPICECVCWATHCEPSGWFVWVRTQTPAERLCVTEQLIRSNACGALLASLPQARPDQLRRLRVSAQGCEGPVFLSRHEGAQYEASAAPLRIYAAFGIDCELRLRLVKSKGLIHAGFVRLRSIPGAIESVLTPCLRAISHPIANCERGDALASATPRKALRRRLHA